MKKTSHCSISRTVYCLNVFFWTQPELACRSPSLVSLLSTGRMAWASTWLMTRVRLVSRIWSRLRHLAQPKEFLSIHLLLTPLHFTFLTMYAPPKLYTKNSFEPVYIFMTTVTLCNICNINQTYILISPPPPPQRFHSLIDDGHCQIMHISYFILICLFNNYMPEVKHFQIQKISRYSENLRPCKAKVFRPAEKIPENLEKLSDRPFTKSVKQAVV